MRQTNPNLNRRRFLVSTTMLGVASTLLPQTAVRGGRLSANTPEVKRDSIGNPVIPSNWQDGPQALDTPEFNPHGRSIPTIRKIYRRKRAGLPHAGYGFMGTVLELNKPISELPEDKPTRK